MRPAYWLPPVAWMAVVLGLSSEGASAEQRSRFLLPLLRWLLPWAAPEQLAALHGLARKAGHVIEYAILTLLWFRAFRRGRGLGPRARARLPPPPRPGLRSRRQRPPRHLEEPMRHRLSAGLLAALALLPAVPRPAAAGTPTREPRARLERVLDALPAPDQR